MCYPELLIRHDPAEYLVECTRSLDVWFLERAQDGLHLYRDVSAHERYDLGVVTSIRHAEAVARRATTRRVVRFAPHPLLSVVLPLWGSSELFAPARLRRLVAAASQVRVERELETRGDQAVAQSADFAHALEAVKWTDIHRLAHSSSRQRLLFHKLKGLRLSGWDALHERRGCPHCHQNTAYGGDAFHIMWECPCAQRLWGAARSWMSTQGLWTRRDFPTDRDFLTVVFSLRIPRTSAKVWELPSLSQCLHCSDDAPEGPYPALQVA